MLARLGFAIATAWMPDILILDEVLSVGDAAFRRALRGAHRELRRGRTAVFLVSHDPGDILAGCDRCLWLDGGRLRMDGDPEEVLATYDRVAREPRPAGMDDDHVPGSTPVLRMGGGDIHVVQLGDLHGEHEQDVSENGLACALALARSRSDRCFCRTSTRNVAGSNNGSSAA